MGEYLNLPYDLMDNLEELDEVSQANQIQVAIIQLISSLIIFSFLPISFPPIFPIPSSFLLSFIPSSISLFLQIDNFANMFLLT